MTIIILIHRFSYPHVYRIQFSRSIIYDHVIIGYVCLFCHSVRFKRDSSSFPTWSAVECRRVEWKWRWYRESCSLRQIWQREPFELRCVSADDFRLSAVSRRGHNSCTTTDVDYGDLARFQGSELYVNCMFETNISHNTCAKCSLDVARITYRRGLAAQLIMWCHSPRPWRTPFDFDFGGLEKSFL